MPRKGPSQLQTVWRIPCAAWGCLETVPLEATPQAMWEFPCLAQA